MTQHLSHVTVVYSETDQMGIVHHSNYLKYYEGARWDLFRRWDIPYRNIEEKGLILPVVKVELEYIKPAYYDQLLTIESMLTSFHGPRLTFQHKIYNADDDLINEATITVAFVNNHTRKPCRPPALLAEKIRSIMEAPARSRIKNEELEPA